MFPSWEKLIVVYYYELWSSIATLTWMRASLTIEGRRKGKKKVLGVVLALFLSVFSTLEAPNAFTRPHKRQLSCWNACGRSGIGTLFRLRTLLVGRNMPHLWSADLGNASGDQLLSCMRYFLQVSFDHFNTINIYYSDEHSHDWRNILYVAKGRENADLKVNVLNSEIISSEMFRTERNVP